MYIIINGGGKIGEYLAIQMSDNGHAVAVIEIDPKKIDHLIKALPKSVLIICGDGCESAIQLDAGAQKADIFVATTGKDDDNLVGCEIAKKVCGVKRTIARVNYPKNERIFRRIGIETVSSTSYISHIIEEEASGTLKNIKRLRNSDINMIDVRLPEDDDDETRLRRGIRVADIHLPQGSVVTAVVHNGKLEVAMPGTHLFPRDVAIVLAKEGVEDEVRERLENLGLCE